MSPPRRSRGPKGATAGEGGARTTLWAAFSGVGFKEAEA
jgi:hypothetical protein